MVPLVDDNQFKVNGIGFVKLFLLDGTIIILSDVRFVSKLRRNLISLGILDILGYSIKIDNGTMRIIKGSLIALKNVRINGHYLWHGLTLDNKGATSVVQSLDNVMLWHRILGHIS